MERHILALLYGILFKKGEEELAKKVYKLRPCSKATILSELSLFERDASVLAVRWIAIAKLAIQGDEHRYEALEQEILKEMGFPSIDEV